MNCPFWKPYKTVSLAAFFFTENHSTQLLSQDLPCKFMLTQNKNLSANLCHYLALILWSAMLQNMLNDVVTILILQEAAGV